MDVLNATRKILIVFLYLSFILFPVIFANKVYSSLSLEKSSDFNRQFEIILDDNSITKALLKVADSNYSDIYIKVACAVVLSAIEFSERMISN